MVALLLTVLGLAVLVPPTLDDPEVALQRSVASAVAATADDRLLEVALAHYPDQGPAIAITYGHLALFQRQLARFGPQVVPIVAAYQDAFTTADAIRLAGATLETVGAQLPDGPYLLDVAPLTAEERGLIALLKMAGEGNAFVGQWEITTTGEARRVPSRLLTLAGPEILIGGLTALERDLVQQNEIDWQTYGLAAVDLAMVASGVALLRFAKAAARGVRASQVATRTAAVRSGAVATARLLGVNAIRFGVPIGVATLLVWHPRVATHYLWVAAEGLGLPGIVGPLIGWGIVVLPLAMVLSWALLSVRTLRFVGMLFAGGARACHRFAVRLAG